VHQVGYLQELKKITIFYAHAQNYEKRILASLCLSVRLSAYHVGMEQLGSCWTAFHKILYLTIF
jgi:hypothetical protein